MHLPEALWRRSKPVLKGCGGGILAPDSSGIFDFATCRTGLRGDHGTIVHLGRVIICKTEIRDQRTGNREQGTGKQEDLRGRAVSSLKGRFGSQTMTGLGKALLAAGLFIALVGALILIAGRAGLPLGRLPGDITYRGKDFTVYIPLGTCVLLSIVLSVLLWVFSLFRR
jgi:hypothetical protein